MTIPPPRNRRLAIKLPPPVPTPDTSQIYIYFTFNCSSLFNPLAHPQPRRRTKAQPKLRPQLRALGTKSLGLRSSESFIPAMHEPVFCKRVPLENAKSHLAWVRGPLCACSLLLPDLELTGGGGERSKDRGQGDDRQKLGGCLGSAVTSGAFPGNLVASPATQAWDRRGNGTFHCDSLAGGGGGRK